MVSIPQTCDVHKVRRRREKIENMGIFPFLPLAPGKCPQGMRKANPERGKLAGWKQESDAKQQESRQRKQESRLWENRKDRAGKNRKRMESVSEGGSGTDFSVWLRGHTEVIRRSADRVKERRGRGGEILL
jgi:hypothetical protein